jgi:hypothetical protein
MRLFPAWKTLKLGAYSDTKGYENELKKYGVDVVANTDDLVLGTHTGKVEVAYLNGFNLQHAMNVHRSVLYNTAGVFGLEPCPDEAVLALAFTLEREDLVKLPFVMATTPKSPRGGSPYVATREGDERLFIFERGGFYGHVKLTAVISDGMCSATVPWVFARGPRAI